MKKLTVFFVLLTVAFPFVVNAATLSWPAPTTYSDATTIALADIARIVYTPYYGASSSGPWTAGTTTAAGALSATVPYPAAGQTQFYTVDCTLDGQTSAKGTPVSYTMPMKTPSAPSGLTIH
jgi:hypothetical protein